MQEIYTTFGTNRQTICKYIWENKNAQELES